jgi:hypothetical protein
MSKNLIQFAPIFSAVGAEINFDTTTLEATILESPKGKSKLIQDALDEVDKFLDTRTYNDGIAIYALANFIDNVPSPIHSAARLAILEALGLTREGKFISQTLALLKSNKSWHTSDKPYQCSYFGELCTNRGVVEVKGKRGRKSTRPPDAYHKPKNDGLNEREQLVTPNLEALYKAIPPESVISAMKPKSYIRLDEIEDLEPEELQLILGKIREVEEARNAAT